MDQPDNLVKVVSGWITALGLALGLGYQWFMTRAATRKAAAEEAKTKAETGVLGSKAELDREENLFARAERQLGAQDKRIQEQDARIEEQDKRIAGLRADVRRLQDIEDRAFEADRKHQREIERCKGFEAEAIACRRELAQARLALKVAAVGAHGFASLWDESSDLWAMVSTKDRGSLLWVSRGWQDHLGIPPEKLLGKAWRELLHPADVAATDRAETSTLAGSVSRFANRFRRDNGEYAQLVWWALRYDDETTVALATVVSK